VDHAEPWHRAVVGGLWDELGKLQFEFLVEQGLRPQHSLLDIGCGSLRAGVHLIRYLDPGKYVGVDRDQALLDAGRDLELDEETLRAKAPTLVCDGDFELQRLGRQFDFALAQSLFTHLPANEIIRCLARAESVLVSGGRLFATFFEAPNRRSLEPIVQSADVTTHLDRDPFHYDPALFEWICEGSDFSVSGPFDWNHPRNQKMLVFTKA
jgi:SAM-dependent methyltransferase